MNEVLVFGNLQLDVLCKPVSSLPVPITISFSITGVHTTMWRKVIERVE